MKNIKLFFVICWLTVLSIGISSCQEKNKTKYYFVPLEESIQLELLSNPFFHDDFIDAVRKSGQFIENNQSGKHYLITTGTGTRFYCSFSKGSFYLKVFDSSNLETPVFYSEDPKFDGKISIGILGYSLSEKFFSRENSTLEESILIHKKYGDYMKELCGFLELIE